MAALLPTSCLVLFLGQSIPGGPSVLLPTLALAKGSVPAAQSPAPTSVQALDTHQFILLTTPDRFLLQFHLRGQKKEIPIPRPWLVPPKEERDEEGEYVSSFKYDNKIAAFAIGNGKLGLHLSSFSLMTDGSAQAAAGRDVFLVFDPRASVITKGLTTLGVTKARVRSDGCFRAQTAHFLLADINQDGLTDIGVVNESIQCPNLSADQNAHPGGHPQYAQQPVEWFVHQKGHWQIARTYRGKIPADSITLPLIGIELSPVDYVGYGYWKNHAPTTWGLLKNEPVPYEPPYRKQLIESDARARRGNSSVLPSEILATTYRVWG
jgi:hypothetical protein